MNITKSFWYYSQVKEATYKEKLDYILFFFKKYFFKYPFDFLATMH